METSVCTRHAATIISACRDIIMFSTTAASTTKTAEYIGLQPTDASETTANANTIREMICVDVNSSFKSGHQCSRRLEKREKTRNRTDTACRHLKMLSMSTKLCQPSFTQILKWKRTIKTSKNNDRPIVMTKSIWLNNHNIIGFFFSFQAFYILISSHKPRFCYRNKGTVYVELCPKYWTWKNVRYTARRPSQVLFTGGMHHHVTQLSSASKVTT